MHYLNAISDCLMSALYENDNTWIYLLQEAIFLDNWISFVLHASCSTWNRLLVKAV